MVIYLYTFLNKILKQKFYNKKGGKTEKVETVKIRLRKEPEPSLL